MEIQLNLDLQGAYDTAGLHLNEWAAKNNYRIPEDFTFLKMRQASFSFFDMSFRYKNQVFAIFLDIIHGKESIFEDRHKRKMQLIEFCRKYNIVPCLFPLDLSLAKESGPQGYGTYCTGKHTSQQSFIPRFRDSWNLLYAPTNARINPSEWATDEPVQMSEYEQYNFATEIAKPIIEKEYGYIVEWNDVLPSNSPQLVYINRERCIEEWCCVRVVDKPIADLTESEMEYATRKTHVYNPIYIRSGLYFIVYIENKNRTDLTHKYQYEVKRHYSIADYSLLNHF